VALQLRRRGVTRVHPLHGGLAEWMALGFPVVELALPPARPREGAAAP
jgi:rhodanese-related sulfurtransferase